MGFYRCDAERALANKTFERRRRTHPSKLVCVVARRSTAPLGGKVRKAFVTFVGLISLFLSQSLLAEQSAMKCEIGPLKKVYGKTNWLVYSCTDDKTLVIVSDTGSPAMPFYFTFYIKNGSYTLSGEGTGNKAATDAAYNQLSKLKNNEISALIKQTKNVK